MKLISCEMLSDKLFSYKLSVSAEGLPGKNPQWLYKSNGIIEYGEDNRNKEKVKRVPPPLNPLSIYKTDGRSTFRKQYLRGNLPIAVEFGARRRKMAWKVALDSLDFHHYVPIFFDGLSETIYPYNFFAVQGSHDLIEHGSNKILPVIPQLIVSLKRALSSRNVVCPVLKILQHMLLACDNVGEALVPYYRQLLPSLNYLRSCNVNFGDGIEYGQMRRENVGDLISETLELLERCGGEDAFINIKYMVPTYESCMLN